jgi:hypothetical protein
MALQLSATSGTRVKEVTDGNKNVIRIAEPNLRASDHIRELNYQLLVFEKGNYDEIKETHLMRFFFLQEIINYLEIVGFKILKYIPF